MMTMIYDDDDTYP